MAKKNEELTLDDLQEQHRQYAEVIGIDNLLRLSDTYGGTSIYIPQRRELLKNRTYNAIYREFDGSNVDQLVKKYGVSKSTIYKIVGDRLGRGGQLPGQIPSGTKTLQQGGRISGHSASCGNRISINRGGSIREHCAAHCRRPMRNGWSVKRQGNP